jgi:hypothetical protein
MGNTSKTFGSIFIAILIVLIIFIPLAILLHDLSKRVQVLIMLPIAAILKYILINYVRSGNFFDEY